MVEYKYKCLFFSSLLNMDAFLHDDSCVVNPLLETTIKNINENVPKKDDEEKEEEKEEKEEKNTLEKIYDFVKFSLKI